MGVERPESEPTTGGADGEPDISGLWLMPLLLAGGICFGLLGGVLGATLDLHKDANISLAAIITVTIATCTRRPRNFRQLGLVAAVGAVVGIVAMLGYLPFTLFARGLEEYPHRLMVMALGMGVAASLGSVVALLGYRWLALPGAAGPRAEDGPDAGGGEGPKRG